jgi:hypothetical protein
VRRPGVASPMTVLPGALGLALIAAWVPLTYLTGDLRASRDGAALAFALACGLLGMLVAQRQPRNPEGWLLLGPAVCAMAVLDSGLYAVLDYRMHHGRLPLGETAVLLKGAIGTSLIFLIAPVILVFPDGRLTLRWNGCCGRIWSLSWSSRSALSPTRAGAIAGRHIQVDVKGDTRGRRPVRFARCEAGPSAKHPRRSQGHKLCQRAAQRGTRRRG